MKKLIVQRLFFTIILLLFNTLLLTYENWILYGSDKFYF